MRCLRHPFVESPSAPVSAASEAMPCLCLLSPATKLPKLRMLSDLRTYEWWLQVYTGKLSLVDLAGSERASETNNVGRQLKDGANINRYSILNL